LSKETKLLLAFLVVGVLLVCSIHAAAFWSAKRRLYAFRGEGTMTPNAVAALRDNHVKGAGLQAAILLGGVCLAKAVLVLARRLSPAPGPGTGPGGGGPGAGVPPSDKAS
jgi:hypothetical protein